MLIFGNKSLTEFLGRKIIEEYIYFNKKRIRILVIPDCSGHPSVCPQDARGVLVKAEIHPWYIQWVMHFAPSSVGWNLAIVEVYNSHTRDYFQFFFQPDLFLFICLLAFPAMLNLNSKQTHTPSVF